MAFALLLLGLLPSVAVSAQEGRAADVETTACASGDRDGDGICDRVERATGTSPVSADTDADGVPDGVEDTDRDGVVDEGESDPRVPGLFPGTYPHIPEPMVFDLVRALGAERGELEANALVVVHLPKQRPHVDWAPEVEWAFADGFALELELPMHDQNVEAIKGALQATLPDGWRSFTHGIQLIEEYYVDAREAETTLLYLAGLRLDAWSVFSMFGVRGITPMRRARHFEGLVNPSLFYDFDERLTLGIESNVAVPANGRVMARVIPQLHVQVGRHFRVQMGGGLHVAGRQVHPLIASRLIVE